MREDSWGKEMGRNRQHTPTIYDGEDSKGKQDRKGEGSREGK